MHGVQFVLLGLESQEHIHYAMPMRIMGYDYGSYKKQYDSNAKKYQSSEGLDEDEFLSKMKKTDKFVPVITLVVYYGEKPWDGAESLHEMLNIPEEMKQFVNDYKMLLVEARENDVNKSVVMTVAGAANCKLDYNAFEKGDGGMCTLFEKIAKENEVIGEAKGIVETGYEFGASEADILKRLQQKLEISLQMAQEFLNMFGKQTV